MTRLFPEGGLRALIDLPLPAPPDELLKLLSSRKQFESEETLHFCEAELQTRLFLYKLLFEKDTSTIPEAVTDELRVNCMTCLALLLNVQWRLRASRNFIGTIRLLLTDDLDSATPALRKFVSDQIAQLMLDSANAALLSAVEDASDALSLPDNYRRILQLGQCDADFKPHQLPPTISALRDFTSEKDETGVASFYLLAMIYYDLRLPFEERECYFGWMAGLAQLYGRTAADLAGAVSGENPAMEGVIRRGAIRWLQLLTASSNSSEVNRIVDEFQKAGYGDEFEPLRVGHGREIGYEFRAIPREEVSNEKEMKALISNVVTSSTKQGACLIVRDDSSSDLALFRSTDSVLPEKEILSRLPDCIEKASLMVLPEIIEESLLQRRKWVVCVDQARPMDAFAVGILPMETEFSVVFARAIVFSTILDTNKDQVWFQGAVRLLGQGFDVQKSGVIRDAVRRIADQISTGRPSTKVIEF
jgi:hypothetical protein